MICYQNLKAAAIVQANPIRRSRRDIEGAGGSSLFDQTPAHKNIRGSDQGKWRRNLGSLPRQDSRGLRSSCPNTKNAFPPETDIGKSSPYFAWNTYCPVSKLG